MWRPAARTPHPHAEPTPGVPFLARINVAGAREGVGCGTSVAGVAQFIRATCGWAPAVGPPRLGPGGWAPAVG